MTDTDSKSAEIDRVFCVQLIEHGISENFSSPSSECVWIYYLLKKGSAQKRFFCACDSPHHTCLQTSSVYLQSMEEKSWKIWRREDEKCTLSIKSQGEIVYARWKYFVPMDQQIISYWEKKFPRDAFNQKQRQLALRWIFIDWILRVIIFLNWAPI